MILKAIVIMFQILMNVYLIHATPMQHVTILMVVLHVLVSVVTLEMAFSVQVRYTFLFVSYPVLIPLFVDIDECAMNTDGCDQQCINTLGSFMCNCSEGYLINDDGFSCDGEGTLLFR